jgi:hypothetical protein
MPHCVKEFRATFMASMIQGRRGRQLLGWLWRQEPGKQPEPDRDLSDCEDRDQAEELLAVH